MAVDIYVDGERRLVLEDLKIDDRHKITNPDGTPPPLDGANYHVDALGGGGFGAVVRASDLLGLPRAIKILTDSAMADSADTNLFIREIQLTNGQPYKHIVPIILYDSVTAGNHTYWYYVSQYVAGPTLKRFMQRLGDHRDTILQDRQLRAAAHDWALNCVADVLAGVVELQSSSIVHMDIKPHNILIHPRTPDATADLSGDEFLSQLQHGGMDAWLIDLGAGKPMLGTGRTTLRYTPYYFPPILDKLFTFGGKIAHDQLAEWGAVIDLYSIGRTFEQLFLDRVRRGSYDFTVNPKLKTEEPLKEAFWLSIFGPNLEVIEGLTDRLLMYDGGGFASAADARFAFATIPLSVARSIYDSPVLIDRIATPSIPLGGSSSTSLSDDFQRLVAHPAFDRLRGIQQLAFVSEIYPDATHTRYTHSLRCYELTKQALMSLSRRSAFRLMFDRHDIDEILAAALLHDIGQYHFSHSIEDLKKLGDLTQDAALGDIQHDQERIDILCDVRDPRGMTIKSLLAEAGIDFEAVRYMTSKRAKTSAAGPKLNIARDLISGIIDMDRVSYLIHDSERTGVPYGAAVNVPALLDALTLKYDRYAALGDVGIGVEEPGITPAEMVFVAVYLMYREVYWHEKNRAFMAAVKTSMLRLLRSRAMTFTQFVTATYGHDDWFAIRLVKEAYDAYLAASIPDGRNPLRDLVESRGLGYEAVWSLRYDESPADRAHISKTANNDDRRALYARLVRDATAERLDNLTAILPMRIGSELGLPFRDGDFLIDIPLKRRLSTTADRAEETLEEMGSSPRLWVSFRAPLSNRLLEWRELRDCSMLVKALEQSEELDSRRVRVFASRDILGLLSESNRDRLGTLVQSALLEITGGWQVAPGSSPPPPNIPAGSQDSPSKADTVRVEN